MSALIPGPRSQWRDSPSAPDAARRRRRLIHRRALTLAAAAVIAVGLLGGPGTRPASAAVCAVVDDYYTINEDAGKQGLNVQANDPCAASGSTFNGFTNLTAALVNADGSTGAGSITIDPDGVRLAYTPPANWNGQVKFGYRIDYSCCGTSVYAYVYITVRPVNDAPFILSSGPVSTYRFVHFAAPGGGRVSVTAGPGGGVDESFQNLTITVSNDNHALFSVQPHLVDCIGCVDVEYWFAPMANGYATISLLAHDDGGTLNGGSDTQLQATPVLIVHSTPVNSAPTTSPDLYSTKVGPISVAGPGVLGNDTDLDGDPLVATASSLPVHGTLSLGKTGSFTYKPNPGFSGVDTFTYIASDGFVTSSPTPVTISVLAPTATLAPGTTAAPVATAPAATTPASSSSGRPPLSPATSSSEPGPSGDVMPAQSESATGPGATIPTAPAATNDDGPETTTIVIAILVVGGLVAIGMLVGWFALRRRKPDQG